MAFEKECAVFKSVSKKKIGNFQHPSFAGYNFSINIPIFRDHTEKNYQLFLRDYEICYAKFSYHAEPLGTPFSSQPLNR